MGLFDRVSDEARGLDPLKLLLTVLAVPFFVAGWAAGKAVKAVATVFLWVWAAIRVGFRDGRGDR